MNTPAISIIIPAYNIGHYIGRCLDSCIFQSFKDLEIIIINDGSTDATAEIIEKYALLDTRINYIHKENEGVNYARKDGIEKSKGEFLFFLDADDTIPQHAIQTLYDNAVISGADIVAGNVAITEVNGSSHIRNYDNFQSGTAVKFLEFILKNNLHYLWGKLIRRTIYNDYEIRFEKRLVIGEDQVQLYQICIFANYVWTVNKVVYHYMKQISSATQSADNKKFAFNQEIYAMNIRELQERFNYNKYIHQQLNLRIIFALIISVGKYGKRQHEKGRIQKLLFQSITEGVFNKPSMIRSNFSLVIKGIICLVTPRAFFYARKMFHNLNQQSSIL